MPAAKFVTEIHGLQNTSMEQNETRFHATENCKDGWVYQYPEEISTVVTEVKVSVLMFLLRCVVCIVFS